MNIIEKRGRPSTQPTIARTALIHTLAADLLLRQIEAKGRGHEPRKGVGKHEKNERLASKLYFSAH